ncbi:MAG: DNA primase [Alphaproteobacteria bacterium]|nr:DNA primase [Alphaproteobacteria bacterium]
MAKFDNNFTDELRQRLSIVDVVSRRVPLNKKGQNFWGCCPFHNEKTPSFSVSEDKGFYHCFGCGEHGDIISFVMKSENVDFKTAIRELAEMAGLKVPEYKPRDPEQIAREESYVGITDRAATVFEQKLFDPIGAHALEYVRRRGFTDDMIKKYRIGYAPKNNIISNTFTNVKNDALMATGLVRRGEYGLYDFFRDKLMFPIFNAHGSIVAFSGRSLDGSEPKYINTTDTEMFHKRQTIFGFNFARDAIHRANRSIVVEGQIDAIQMQCHGFGETVAPLGTALTADHIAILCKSNRNITFCFDGDNAGQKAAVRACDIVLPFLRDNSDVRFAFVTGGKDPDEVLKSGGESAMRKIIDSATPLIDFLWQTINKNYIVSTPGGRSQAEKFLKSQIEKITDIDFRREIENEYDTRKFNEWHKWRKNKDNAPQIELPAIDEMTKKTLVYIVNTYPELVERYGEFLSGLNIDFDSEIVTDAKLDLKSSEKYIVSLKLNRYIDKLKNDRTALIQMALAGDSSAKDQIIKIDSDIASANEKLENLMNME